MKSGEQSHYVVIRVYHVCWLVVRIVNMKHLFVNIVSMHSRRNNLSLHTRRLVASIQHEKLFIRHWYNILKIKNFGNRLEVPFTIFADFEALLLPTPDPKRYSEHQPSAVACLTVSSFPEYNKEEMFVYTRADAMQQFFAHFDGEKVELITFWTGMNLWNRSLQKSKRNIIPKKRVKILKSSFTITFSNLFPCLFSSIAGLSLNCLSK